jgi:hypothetical protein
MEEREDWLASYQRKEAERLERGKELGEYLAGALRFLGVKRVTVAFDGSGDDGEVQQPKYEPKPKGELPEGLDLALRDCCAWQLPGGWEINAGSVGAVVIDAEAGTSRVDIEWREEEEEFDEDFME